MAKIGCCCDYDPPGLRCRACSYFQDHGFCSDSRRKADEQLKVLAAASRATPRPEPVRCDCYGSLFSHDIDCATNLERIEAAGYKLVRIGDENDS